MRLLFLIAAAGMTLSAADKPRIYITESGVTEVTAADLLVRKGLTPENIEVMKAFQKHCPAVVVTNSREKADYVLRFDRESPSPITPFIKGNKVAVFDRNDDLVYTDSARYLSAAVKNTCSALSKRSSLPR
jgi:hypothetical protein